MSEYCKNCAGVAERYEDQADRLDKRIRALEAAADAVKAHVAGRSAIEAWYKKWKPDYYAEYGLPSTEGSSMRYFLMDHAAQLLESQAETEGKQ